MAETGFVSGSRVRTATEPPSESNYFVDKGVVKFNNENFPAHTAQAIFTLTRRAFAAGGLRDSLVVTIMGKYQNGKNFEERFRVSIHCP